MSRPPEMWIVIPCAPNFGEPFVITSESSAHYRVKQWGQEVWAVRGLERVRIEAAEEPCAVPKGERDV